MTENEKAARQKKISHAIMWIVLLVLFICFIMPFILVIIMKEARATASVMTTRRQQVSDTLSIHMSTTGILSRHSGENLSVWRYPTTLTLSRMRSGTRSMKTTGYRCTSATQTSQTAQLKRV